MSQTELCSQAPGPEGEAGVYPNDWIFETVYLKQTETGEQGKLTLPGVKLSHTALHCCPPPGAAQKGLQLKAMGHRNTEVPCQPHQPMGNTPELTHHRAHPSSQPILHTALTAALSDYDAPDQHSNSYVWKSINKKHRKAFKKPIP